MAKRKRLRDVIREKLHGEITEVTEGFGEFLVGKDEKYGDAYGKEAACMRLMFPDGLPAKRMDDGAYMFEVLQKLSRIATDHEEEDEDPWRDIAGVAFHAQSKRNIKKRFKEGV